MPDGGEEMRWKVFTWLWEKKAEIWGKLKGLSSWFLGADSGTPPADKGRGILIIGAGGTGKTTLGKLLGGQYNLLLDSLGDYQESTGIESFSLSDDPGVEILVPPGQEQHRGADWADLLHAISAGEFRGIILTVAYGYHSLGISYKGHRFYHGDKEEFLRTYLADRRAEELSVLRKLVPHIDGNRARIWLATVITKQDLWWPQHGEVERHYLEGEYGTEVRKLLNQQGYLHFRHELIPASLVISNFETVARERLKANTEGYDQRLQVASLRRLFEVFDSLKNWEGTNGQ